ncbi:MAG: type I DNA topoisomerase [Ruminococcaceae bacterium]|nr:type I DNA topoisomerase [Oscillospiraceae bacterium]
MVNLVIVESPTKIAPIKKYLGSNYKVIASKGHVRDLPKSSFGVDIENGFEPHYINIRGKGDVIKEIRKEAKGAKKIFLATDPDREGEAIAWHLATTLGIPVEKTLRVSFNEITPTVVKASIKEPRNIDMNLVNAQQARRILDRIVGYKLSPFLWKNVKSGLSAGRVQSAATRIIVDREEEIRAFKPEEYWTIDAFLVADDGKVFPVHFYGDAKGKIKISNEKEANAILSAMEGKEFRVNQVKRSKRKKLPMPPFTTSTLQQEASKKLNFQSSRVMRVAQELYEGIHIGSELGGTQGLITYMRTDSQRVSADAQSEAMTLIREKYGDKFCPKTPRVYKSRTGAQDAHEAIRPARVSVEPQMIKKYLTSDQYRLYKLIWDRFVASQMEAAVLDTVNAEFACGDYIFKASGYSVAFRGYMAVYEEAEEEVSTAADEIREVRDIRLPDIHEGQMLASERNEPARHFTEAPPRYNEASLIKFLEEKGIGRPGTYAPTITTILARNYVAKENKAFVPTSLGEVMIRIMKENFSDIVDYQFTADVEDDLDNIEKGKQELDLVLAEFWNGFSKELAEAEKNIGTAMVEVPVEETDIVCDKCGAKMIVKSGRFGKFAACPNYPTCRNTKPLEAKTPEEKPVVADFKCEKCGGDMILKKGPYGDFYACANYPTCRFTKQKTEALDVPCPKCGAAILKRYGRGGKSLFYSCENYPKCDFSTWDMPVAEKCPSCGEILYRKKGKTAMLICHNAECGFKKKLEEGEAEE